MKKSDETSRFARNVFLLIIVLFVLQGIIVGFFLFSKDTRPGERVIVEKTGEVIDGKTPIKGVDYFDGMTIIGSRGEKGEKGDSVKGDKGDQGSPAPIIIPKDGYTPVKGIDYNDGAKGDSGENGRTPEFRCNKETLMYEMRYQGDEDWIPQFKVVGCPE